MRERGQKERANSRFGALGNEGGGRAQFAAKKRVWRPKREWWPKTPEGGPKRATSGPKRATSDSKRALRGTLWQIFLAWWRLPARKLRVLALLARERRVLGQQGVVAWPPPPPVHMCLPMVHTCAPRSTVTTPFAAG